MVENGIDNVHITSMERVMTPNSLRGEIPNPNTSLVVGTRREIGDILHGRDKQRLLMVVGPCSINDLDAAREYAHKLKPLKDELADQLLIVMRTYPEKPRTTVGWTGLSYSSDSEDPNAGVRITRQLLADTNAAGLPCAIEVLDPYTPQFTADLVSWGAIGARTVESQTHRQLVSGLSMPIGFKNSTSGDINVAADAMVAAKGPHNFYGIDGDGRMANVHTTGNPDTHIVLRGGGGKTNYDEGSILKAVDAVARRGLLDASSRPVMIDCSHGNSNKDHKNQPGVIRSVLDQAASRPHLMGFMLESNLYEGRQDVKPGQELQYGVSITDACIGFAQTEQVLREAARAVRARRF